MGWHGADDNPRIPKRIHARVLNGDRMSSMGENADNNGAQAGFDAAGASAARVNGGA